MELSPLSYPNKWSRCFRSGSSTNCKGLRWGKRNTVGQHDLLVPAEKGQVAKDDISLRKADTGARFAAEWANLGRLGGHRPRFLPVNSFLAGPPDSHTSKEASSPRPRSIAHRRTYFSPAVFSGRDWIISPAGDRGAVSLAAGGFPTLLAMRGGSIDPSLK